jgi:hypothetical protein
MPDLPEARSLLARRLAKGLDAPTCDEWSELTQVHRAAARDLRRKPVVHASDKRRADWHDAQQQLCRDLHAEALDLELAELDALRGYPSSST